MEIRQIKYFIEVAKTEHMTEAALNLHVAQSAVSQQIANLEKELNVKLFERSGRNVKLTPVGRIFLEHIEIAMLEMEHAVEKVNEFLNPETGVIRLGFPNSIAANTLPRVISSFRQEYPKVNLHVEQGSIQYLFRSIVEGKLNLAFVTPVPKDEKKVSGRIFFSEKLIALVPDDHPLSEQNAIRLNQLRNEPFILLRIGLEDNIILEACQRDGFQPTVAFEGENIDTIKNLVAAGLGLSLLPESTVYDNLPQGTKKISVLEPMISRTVGMITTKKRDLSPSEKLFYDYICHFYDTVSRFGQFE